MTWDDIVAMAKSRGVSATWIARRPGLNDKKCFSLREAEAYTHGVKGATIEPRVVHLSAVGGEA